MCEAKRWHIPPSEMKAYIVLTVNPLSFSHLHHYWPTLHDTGAKSRRKRSSPSSCSMSASLRFLLKDRVHVPLDSWVKSLEDRGQRCICNHIELQKCCLQAEVSIPSILLELTLLPTAQLDPSNSRNKDVPTLQNAFLDKWDIMLTGWGQIPVPYPAIIHLPDDL